MNKNELKFAQFKKIHYLCCTIKKQLKTMAENKRKEEFACVVLSRGDFECMGYDTSNISDEKMEYIARKIGDLLVDDMYWEQIKAWAETEMC